MDARMPEPFYEAVIEFLPELKEPGPQGGRRPVPHDTVLKVIWFVLVTGCRWKDVPLELGCCGETARTRLQAWKEAGIWDRVHRVFLTMLRQQGKLDTRTAIIDSTQLRVFGGGDRSGPSPVDRRKDGTKYSLLVDRHGIPLVLQSSSANTSDHRQILSTVVAFPHVGGRPGRPKEHPDELYADAGYDSDAARCILRFLGIEPHIRRRKGTHGSHLGRVRWVVERTISWIKGLRRMRIRYDRKDSIIDAWSKLAAGVICFQMLSDSLA